MSMWSPRWCFWRKWLRRFLVTATPSSPTKGRWTRFSNCVIDDRPQSKLFEAFSRELLRDGMCVRFEARGASMSPAIRDGEMVHVRSVDLAGLRAGDIVLAKSERGFRLHRLVLADAERDVFITRGDCGAEDDPAVG